MISLIVRPQILPAILLSVRQLTVSAPLWQEGDDVSTNQAMDLLHSAQKTVRGRDPLERSIDDWRLLLDWNLQRQRPMVVIDPNDPEGIMYLTSSEYRELQKVCLSTSMPLTVIARPGVTVPSIVSSAYSSFKKMSPTFPRVTQLNHKHIPRPSMFRNKLWNTFIKARSWIPTSISVNSEGAIALSNHSGTVVWKTTFMWGRQAFHYSGLTRQSLCFSSLEHFGRHLVTILRYQGPVILIARLKIYLFVMNNYIGGERMKTTQDLGIRVRLKNGLPLCFPQRVRNAISSGSLPVIRWWASLLNMYKALGAPYGEIDLTSICAPPFTGDLGDWCESVMKIWDSLWSNFGPFPSRLPKVNLSRFTQKAGPNGANLTSGPEDAWLWFANSRNYILEYFESFGEWNAIARLTEAAQLVDMEIYLGGRFGNNPVDIPRIGNLGKLAYKLEAAGKIRVFALVDYWTHLALEPLHKYIFNILKLLPTDATFDQSGRLESFVRECNTKDVKSFFCYDLKSATDLIPLPLYIEVLIPLIGRSRAELWADLLIKRGFFVPRPPKGGGELPKNINEGDYIRYTRGQPMGALSSWAGLALVHHFLVQASWIKSGGEGWFGDYLVLGDDIVIAKKEVADAYLEICSQYGIVVGIAKSLISEIGLINFANQTFIKTDNISPISLKEELKARSWGARLALAKRTVSRWFPEAIDSGIGKMKNFCPVTLLKRVLTVPQWNLYQGSLLRGKDYLGLGHVLNILAQNPFAGRKADELMGAEEIIDWVRRFFPDTLHLLSRLSLIEDLSLVFYHQMAQGILRRIELLQVLRASLPVIARRSQERISSGESAIDSYPMLGWTWIIEYLMYPKIDQSVLELQELWVQSQNALGYHENLISGNPRILRDRIHGPNVIYHSTGLIGGTIDDQIIQQIENQFSLIISIWLKFSRLTVFGVGSFLSNPSRITELANQGKFGSLLQGLIPEEYIKTETNKAKFGQGADPNLLKIPIGEIQNVLVAHLGVYTHLSALVPELNSSITAKPIDTKEAERIGIPPYTPSLITNEVETRIAAEATFIATIPEVVQEKPIGIYSEEGSLERVIGGTKSTRLKLMLNGSRKMRDLPLIRGDIYVSSVEIGKPGSGDFVERLVYSDPNDDIGVD